LRNALSEADLMTAESFDVLILGGGNTGIAVTSPVRRARMSVAMIEARDLGGTCTNQRSEADRPWPVRVFLLVGCATVKQHTQQGLAAARH
jgi:monoamine oxidase